MKNYTIKQYELQDYENWNTFISKAKNATFLFHRDFMEYHSDRFLDASLIVLEDEKWVAVLPANRVEDIIYSHQGLTYGGLVYDEKINCEKVEEILNNILNHLKLNKISEVRFKLILSFYNNIPCHELEYFIFKQNGVLYDRYLNLGIDYAKPLEISKSKLKHYKRISHLDIEVREEQDRSLFWNQILIPRLQLKHQVNPVHSEQEINELKSKFPKNIKQFNAYFEGEIVAGITLFFSRQVVKSQYGATSEKGEKIRALDFLFISLIKKYVNEFAFFDMGTVNDGDGYNKGLLKQKEELGCKIYLQDFYKIGLL